MKPICSIKGGWCIKPTTITVGCTATDVYGDERQFTLIAGMTFEQFMRDYASCTAPIYFVEEE